MSQRMKKEYRTILRASLREGLLHVGFADGGDVAVRLSRLVPGYKSGSIGDVQAHASHVSIMIDGKDCEIAWSTIRRATDRKFDQRFAKAASEERYLVGVRLAELRRNRGLTARSVADIAGISPQSLSRIEHGRHDLVLSTLEKILAAIGSSMQEFVEATAGGDNLSEKDPPAVTGLEADANSIANRRSPWLDESTGAWIPTQSDFVYWSSLLSLSTELRQSIQQADIVLVPQPGFGDYTGPLFPVRTEELFRHLRQNVPAGLKVELAVEDADYKELALHADIVRIATVLVKWLTAPLAIDLIKDYLKGHLGKRFKSAEVRFTMIVDQSDGRNKKAGQISYEGPADTFESLLKHALDSLGTTHTKNHVAMAGDQPDAKNDTHRNREVSHVRKGTTKRSDA